LLYTNNPDEHAPLRVQVVGEIGITGEAPTPPTAKRIRDLPITLNELL
jgi:hypothetical protein